MATPANKARPGQYLTFKLHGQAYGAAINTVREIIQIPDITPVPQVPHFVAGVVNLRGKVIPVVDLGLKFSLPQAGKGREACVIVIDGENGQTGMMVDAVLNVIDLVESNIEPTPSMGQREGSSFVIGMGKADGHVVILVDVVNALSRENFNACIDIAQAAPLTAALATKSAA